MSVSPPGQNTSLVSRLFDLAEDRRGLATDVFFDGDQPSALAWSGQTNDVFLAERLPGHASGHVADEANHVYRTMRVRPVHKRQPEFNRKTLQTEISDNLLHGHVHITDIPIEEVPSPDYLQDTLTRQFNVELRRTSVENVTANTDRQLVNIYNRNFVTVR